DCPCLSRDELLRISIDLRQTKEGAICLICQRKISICGVQTQWYTTGWNEPARRLATTGLGIDPNGRKKEESTKLGVSQNRDGEARKLVSSCLPTGIKLPTTN